MSHFYGSIQGRRGEATRAGDKGSGYRAWAASWSGRIEVYLRYDANVDKDRFYIRMTQHGASPGWTGTLASGYLGEQPEIATLLPTPTIEAFTDEAIAAEVKRRFGFDLVLRKATA